MSDTISFSVSESIKADDKLVGPPPVEHEWKPTEFFCTKCGEHWKIGDPPTKACKG